MPTLLFDAGHVRIAIITALPKEQAAMKAMLDEPTEHGGRLVGRIPASSGGSHVVAVALLPEYGNNMAAISAAKLPEYFPNLEYLIMCGIAGGIPKSVRLGDIVVCNGQGVIQYDLVKRSGKKTEYRHSPRPPAPRLLEAVLALEAGELENKRPWEAHVARASDLQNGQRPNDEVGANGRPIAYASDPSRRAGRPRVFIAPIGSANTLLKNAKQRDRLARELKIKAIEMEGSGIADAAHINELRGYLVVRGICDFCDRKKGDAWQGYAAVAAAAYTRALIESLPAPAPGSARDQDTSNDISRYRETLREAVRWADHGRFLRRGLAPGSRQELRATYVEPELSPDDRDQRSTRLPWATVFSEHPALLLCGGAGMGKTTLLARIALDAPDDLLPVLMPAGSFRADRDRSLTAFALRTIHDRWADLPPAVFAALEAALEGDRILFLIDGLNEATEEHGCRLNEHIADWRAAHPSARCVLTARPWIVDTIGAPAGFATYHLAGLSRAQALELIRKLTPTRDQHEQRVFQLFESKRPLRDLATNPLLLTLTARLTATDAGSLQHWADVYEHAVRILFRGPGRDALRDEELEQQVRAWSIVAAGMQRSGQTSIRVSDVHSALGEAIAHEKISASLENAANRAGLVEYENPREIRFFHPSFQEYFAAVRWTDAETEPLENADRFASSWRPMIAKRQNRDALRLAFGRLTFHLGENEARLAQALIERAAHQPEADVAIDGAWLCLSADAIQDGVPVARATEENIVARLAGRLSKIMDWDAADKLTALLEMLGVEERPGEHVTAAIAELLDRPQDVPSALLAAGAELLAAAAATQPIARIACERMYARTRPRDDQAPPFGYGWTARVGHAAALGLLRCGIIPDARAVLGLASQSERCRSKIRSIATAIAAHSVFIESALQPYLTHDNEGVRVSATRLAALASPAGRHASAFLAWSVEHHEIHSIWVEELCARSAPIRAQLMLAAAEKGTEAIRSALTLLVEVAPVLAELAESFAAWLLPRRFSIKFSHELHLHPWPHEAPRVREFRTELSLRLRFIAESTGAPQAHRAAGWHVLVPRPNRDDPRLAGTIERLSRFAAAAPIDDAAEWLEPLLCVGANGPAIALAERIFRDGDLPQMKQAAEAIVSGAGAPPTEILGAIEARAELAANARRPAEVFTCADIFVRHPPVRPGVLRALQEVLRSGVPSDRWEAVLRLIPAAGVDRERALAVLEMMNEDVADRAWWEIDQVLSWLTQRAGFDESLMRAVIKAAVADDCRQLWDFVRILSSIVSARPESIALLLEELRSSDRKRDGRVRHLLEMLLRDVPSDRASTIVQHLECQLDDPQLGIEVARAIVGVRMTTERCLAALRERAQGGGAAAKQAARALRDAGESSPEHWALLTLELSASDLDTVLEAALRLILEDRRPAELKDALRRCSRGSPEQALRAAMIRYAMGDEPEELVPQLLACLGVHQRSSTQPEVWLVEERRRKLAPEHDNERPLFGFGDTIAERAARLLVEMRRPEIVPVLIEWVRSPSAQKWIEWLFLLRELGAESHPRLIEWLMEQITHAEVGDSATASHWLTEWNLAPALHASALIERLAIEKRKDDWAFWATSERLVVLVAKNEDAARVAEQGLQSLDVELAGLTARWLIGTGRSSARTATAYVEGWLKNGRAFDPITDRSAAADSTLAGVLDARRLGENEHVRQEWIARCTDGEPDARTRNASYAIAWADQLEPIPEKNRLLLEGPLRAAIIAALEGGLRCADGELRIDAARDLDGLDAFGSTAEETTLAALSASVRLGDHHSTSRCAGILIRRGRAREAREALRLAVQQVPGVEDDFGWLAAAELLADQPDEAQAIREPLRAWIRCRRAGSVYFHQVLRLLLRVDGNDESVRAAVLEAFCEGPGAAYARTIRQWGTARGGPDDDSHRVIYQALPPDPTDADRLRARLDWLEAQGIPDTVLEPAMKLLAARPLAGSGGDHGRRFAEAWLARR